MRITIVTGMSGGGKSTVINMLEDAGYYCVDNLPPPLIEKFIELCLQNGEVKKVAIGIDFRAGHPFGDIHGELRALRTAGYQFEILFMEAGDTSLMKRYKESRRFHPLALSGRIEDGIHTERQLLGGIRHMSNYVIDTSHLLVRELKEKIDQIFVLGDEYNNLIVNIVSFGFKNGILNDADLVFDVRFLPNPFYIEELKHKTGEDMAVRDFCLASEGALDFMHKLCDMISFLIPAFIKEGKYQLVVGIGCTGGKHRSVTVATRLHEHLHERNDCRVKLSHRDLKS